MPPENARGQGLSPGRRKRARVAADHPELQSVQRDAEGAQPDDMALLQALADTTDDVVASPDELAGAWACSACCMTVRMPALK